MKYNFKKAFYVFLASLILFAFFSPGAIALDPSAYQIEAAYSAGSLRVNGEAEINLLAVALLVYKDDNLLRLETTGVKEGVFTATIKIKLEPGTYKVKAANYTGGEFFAETDFTVVAAPSSPSGGGGGGVYTADINGGGKIPVLLDLSAENAAVNLANIAGALGRGENIGIELPSIPGVSTYTANIPVSALSGTDNGSLTFTTGAGSITVLPNMLTDIEGLKGKEAKVSIGLGDKTALSEDLQEAIGDKPLIWLSLAIDGKIMPWDNPQAPVEVSIPYTPTSAELENPENIIIWYIDGSGNIITIPNGRYDSASGKVIFSTTHFSNFAVAYNKISFNDVKAEAWYNRAISFIAARGITTGTGDGNFSPQARLTRGQFIVFLMRAYGIEEDSASLDNFTDAGNTYYTNYLAAAKRLGISTGIGNNMYGPENKITRQEMFTLLYNALKALGKTPEGGGKGSIRDFSDAGLISPWAQEALTAFIAKGIISGSNGSLNPQGSATRGEMAQLLYNLFAN